MANALTWIEGKLANSIEFFAAAFIGLVAALCLWLWGENLEMVTISSALAGLANCL